MGIMSIKIAWQTIQHVRFYTFNAHTDILVAFFKFPLDKSSINGNDESHTSA